MSMSLNVFSNHFAAGYRSDQCTTSTLYLKGYTHLQEIKKRKLPNKRKLLTVCSPHHLREHVKLKEMKLTM